MHDRLRLCPACSRRGHHFIVHQLRPFSNCPLHGLPLRDRCHRCGELLSYGLGTSIVFGPINCPTYRAPQLPLSVGGQPVAIVMSARGVEQIGRWLPFLQRRINLAVLYELDGRIDAGQLGGAVRSDRMRAIMPPRSTPDWLLPIARGPRCTSSSRSRPVRGEALDMDIPDTGVVVRTEGASPGWLKLRCDNPAHFTPADLDPKIDKLLIVVVAPKRRAFAIAITRGLLSRRVQSRTWNGSNSITRRRSLSAQHSKRAAPFGRSLVIGFVKCK